MPDSDSQLAQGTVDFRNEERRAANGSDQIRTPKPTDHDHPVWAEIIEALQRAAIEVDIGDDLADTYDEGYVNGLNRAADIVQILAHGGKPAS